MSKHDTQNLPSDLQNNPGGHPIPRSPYSTIDKQHESVGRELYEQLKGMRDQAQRKPPEYDVCSLTREWSVGQAHQSPAELSVTARFAALLNEKAATGWDLHDWKHSVVVADGLCGEKIIAIFKRGPSS